MFDQDSELIAKGIFSGIIKSQPVKDNINE